jgi:hypothetical protein
MTAWLRRAGRGRLQDGADVTWSVAEGSRGRRWRWTVAADGALRSSALAELDDRGLFARLELVTAVGMLTFHPEPDGGSAHGNVVSADGVRPIAAPWQGGWGIELAGDAFGSALLAGQETMLAIASDLALGRTGDEPAQSPLEIDERGVPVLDAAEEWDLEE